MTEKVLDHKWERADLGKPPYRFIGLYSYPSKGLLEAGNIEGYNNQMRMAPDFIGGVCHYCGTPIMHFYMCQSADGHKFAVGSECVGNIGDAKLMTAAKKAKNAMLREQARERRAKKEEADRLACEAALQEERDRNGGLTDWEVEQKAAAEAEAARVAPIVEILEPLAYRLADGRGGFCDSVARDLRRGQIPYGRGRDIMIEILAKDAGRMNSKAYDKEWDLMNAEVLKAEQLINGGENDSL